MGVKEWTQWWKMVLCLSSSKTREGKLSRPGNGSEIALVNVRTWSGESVMMCSYFTFILLLLYFSFLGEGVFDSLGR